MQIKIYIFDIDETLLSTIETGRYLLNKVPRQISDFNPYPPHDWQYTCITLNKDKMQTIIKSISNDGHVIGFITKGGLTSQDMRLFFESEYNVSLGEDFPFYNRTSNKTPALQKIAEQYSVTPNQIALIDNGANYIKDANEAGFYTTYVDNNPYDDTHGSLYIEKLEKIISEKEDHESKKENFQEKDNLSVNADVIKQHDWMSWTRENASSYGKNPEDTPETTSLFKIY